MGNSACVGVTNDNDETVWFYAHYLGGETKDVVAAALNGSVGRARWNDAGYLARIIFSALIKDDIDSDSGFGISTSPWRSDRGRIIVDVGEGHVHLRGWTDNYGATKERSESLTLEEFCQEAPADPPPEVDDDEVPAHLADLDTIEKELA